MQLGITYECLLNQWFIKLNAVCDSMFKRKYFGETAFFEKNTKKVVLLQVKGLI